MCADENVKKVIRRRVTSDPQGKSLTEQSHKVSCDVNNIMAKYHRTGVLPVRGALMPLFGDFSHVVDYQTCCQAMIDIQTSFDRLPAEARKKFRNNPLELVEFLKDESNHEEAIKLGLIEKTTLEAAQAASQPVEDVSSSTQIDNKSEKSDK